MRYRSILAIALGLLCFAVSAHAQPAVDTLNPSKDNTLYETSDTPLSNGAGQYIFAGQTDFSNVSRRAVLAFDIASTIPGSNTIDSVKLLLVMNRTISGAQDMNLHRLTADWGEGSVDAGGQEGGGAPAGGGDATWTHTFFDQNFWASPGGDFDPTSSATASVAGNGTYTWSSSQMTTDVTDWRDNAGNNFGWILIGNEAAQATAKRFHSKEATTASNRPQLIIYHTASGEVCCVGNTGDINDDGAESDPVDLAYLVDFLFAGGPAAPCPEEADVNGDGATADPVDLAYFVDYLFSGGPAPVACS